MGKARTIASAGGAVLIAALGFIYAGWPDYIRQHPYWVIGLAAVGALMMLAPVIQWVYPIFKDAVPFAAKLQIQERCTAPSLDRFKRGVEHIFFLADVELTNPDTAEVTYSLDLIRDGITYTTEWAEDVEQWQVFDKGENRGEAFPLAVHLVRGTKVDGWLHFRVDSIGESELRGCRIRLRAKTKRDSLYCEYPGNAWPMPPRDLTMKTRPIPDSTREAFHDLLDRAATTPVASVPVRKGKPE